jgi:hypothetical protein
MAIVMLTETLEKPTIEAAYPRNPKLKLQPWRPKDKD